MKKSIASVFLAFVFLTVLLIGCAPAPTPVPPTFTASPKPTSTATVTPLPSVTPTSIPTDTPTSTPDLKPPFGSQYTTVEFIGKKFELKFTATDQPVQIYEYYLPNESPADWIELVEIQIYPVNPDGNKPIDFAKRVAAAFLQQYPDMRYALITDNNSDAAVLDFFYPTSSRKEKGKEFLEFDAFKFFSVAGGTQTMSFHYAKNIEFINPDSFASEFKKTREEIVSAMAEFPLFSP